MSIPIQHSTYIRPKSQQTISQIVCPAGELIPNAGSPDGYFAPGKPKPSRLLTPIDPPIRLLLSGPAFDGPHDLSHKLSAGLVGKAALRMTFRPAGIRSHTIAPTNPSESPDPSGLP